MVATKKQSSGSCIYDIMVVDTGGYSSASLPGPCLRNELRCNAEKAGFFCSFEDAFMPHFNVGDFVHRRSGLTLVNV